MKDKKLLKLFDFVKNINEETSNDKVSSVSYQTNPIVQRLLFTSVLNKKNKFSFNDLFK